MGTPSMLRKFARNTSWRRTTSVKLAREWRGRSAGHAQGPEGVKYCILGLQMLQQPLSLLRERERGDTLIPAARYLCRGTFARYLSPDSLLEERLLGWGQLCAAACANVCSHFDAPLLEFHNTLSQLGETCHTLSSFCFMIIFALSMSGGGAPPPFFLNLRLHPVVATSCRSISPHFIKC